MYPSGQLKELAVRKAVLQQRIAVQRARCVLEAAQILPPLQLADELILKFQRMSPLLRAVGLPLGAWLGRRLLQRKSAADHKFRWGDALVGAVRSLAAVRNGH